MTFDERVQALRPFGFSPRQTAFLVTVALHGGYCLRRQYSAFAGVSRGQVVQDFFAALVNRNLLEPLRFQPNRGDIYHLHAKALYRAIEQSDNRNRREVSPIQIARKLMVLDHVLATPGCEWLATEHDKVAYFTTDRGVALIDLPCRSYESSNARHPGTTRYFIHKLPIALDRSSIPIGAVATNGTVPVVTGSEGSSPVATAGHAAGVDAVSASGVTGINHPADVFSIVSSPVGDGVVPSTSTKEMLPPEAADVLGRQVVTSPTTGRHRTGAVTFVYLVHDETGAGFEQFLQDHLRLISRLSDWTISVVCPPQIPRGLEACRRVFARTFAAPPDSSAGTPPDDLRWFFRARQAVDRGDLRGLSVAELDRFRDARQRWGTASIERLYAAWQRHGDEALGANNAQRLISEPLTAEPLTAEPLTAEPLTAEPLAPTVNLDRLVPVADRDRLTTQLLPFRYRQLGSMPGVA
jgi:hypothetical protein